MGVESSDTKFSTGLYQAITVSDIEKLKISLSICFILVDIPTTGEVKRTSSSETYLHGLYKFTNYTIKVLAYTEAGDGVMSDHLFCRTEEDRKL